MLQAGAAGRGGNIGAHRRRHRPRRGAAAPRRTDGSCRRRPRRATPTSPRGPNARSRLLQALTAPLRARGGRARGLGARPGQHPPASRAGPCAAGIDLDDRRCAGRHLGGGAGRALPGVRRGARASSSKRTAPRPATSRCARSPPAACSSAAASRRRSCRRSTTGAFIRAFRAKAPFEPMLDAMPVKVILNPRRACSAPRCTPRAH